MTEAHPIRTITPEEFEALTEVPNQAFLHTWPREALERERLTTEYDRTLVALDDQRMVGTGAAYSYQLAVPGGSVPAAGVTMIAVLPSYRRRGILTGLMTRLFSDAQSRSEPVAILFATEAGIYGRFGYGLGTQHQELTIRRGEGQLAVGPAAAALPGDLRLRETEPLQARAELATVFDTVFARQPGTLARDDRWWTYRLTDVPSLRSPGASAPRCLLAEDDHGARGYVLYQTKPGWDDYHLAAGSLHVRELHATDPAAYAALWADVLSRDLVAEVNALMRPIDDPLLALLADPRRARPAPADGLWVRLIDVRAALTRRSYAAPADVVLDVIDPVISGNAGLWRLRTTGRPASGGSETTTCERAQGAADVRVTVQALGASYLGGASFGQLAGAGQVAELTPGALAALAAAMSWDRAPYSGMMF
jgi:predicted acetyltransferase